MTFNLVDLPFAEDALGAFMSAETLRFHHGKHHRAYVDKVNESLDDNGHGSLPLVELIQVARRQGDTKLFNNAAQVWNHNFFWKCLAPPDSRRPTGKLATLIDGSFGSTTALLDRLKKEAVGHFGSGWAWLVLDGGELKVTSLHDADTPVVHDGMQPLLTLDVWEHAYYIDYRNARPDYADKVLDHLVDWDFVAANLDGDGIRSADQQADATVLESAD